MQREIKFRAWDIEQKKMNSNPRAYLNDGEVNCAFEDDDFVWMQFTGLLDKNGKNDIVRWTQGILFIQSPVVWSKASSGWFPFVGSMVVPTKNAEECEVIGNIYENY